MMRALLAVRFRALFAVLTRQGRRKKKSSIGTTFLYIVLYLYLAVIICGMTGMMFTTLAESYHAAKLDWLYFSVAGLMGLGFAVIGSVFTTQNQLYDAKDNDLLLPMPVPPRMVLLSRMLPLLALNVLFAGLVILPAMVVYAIFVEFSLLNVLLQLLCLICVTILAQAIACLFGWLFHLLMSHMNKSLASLLYMVLFLGIYFYVYSQAGQILNTIATNGEAIAAVLESWVWPLTAMGRSCLGSPLHLIGFLLICTAAFGIVWAILSYTFLSSTARKGGSRKHLSTITHTAAVSSPVSAVTRKEWRKFIGCPVYLTNMGLGVILALVLPVVGIIFRSRLMLFLQVPEIAVILSDTLPLLICAMMAFLVSTMCISTPSVSLEGKNLWILKSMPLSSKQILLAKLKFHNLLTVPVTVLSTLVLTVIYGCSLPDCLLSALALGLLAMLCGLIGMLSGLKWVRLDYISEAYPCKQSISVLITMLATMAIPVALGMLYGFWLINFLSTTVFLGVSVLLLLGWNFGLYRVLITWGIRKWDSLS